MRLSLRIFVVLLCLLAGLGAAAHGPANHAPGVQKEPWEWTTDERLAERLDPAKIIERQREQEAGHSAPGAQPQTAERQGVQNYDIDGSRHPELLLPHELFQSLLTGFVPDDERRNRQRESLRPGIIAAGFGEEIFWTKLREAASDYIDRYAYPRPGMTAPASRGSRDALCRAAFLALNNARRAFGRDQFDRFLYEGVAPRTQVASATSAIDPAVELRFVAGGCR